MKDSPLDILLIDGHLEDAERALKAWQACSPPLAVSHFPNGQDSLFALRKIEPHQNTPRPRLVVFDWDLPYGNGQEVLAEIKSDANLREIPVVIWTASSQQNDVLSAYNQFANSYVVKPSEGKDFKRVLQDMASFWLSTAQLPEP